MPYLRPGLSGLQQQALTDIITAPNGDGPALFRRAISLPLSYTLAMQANGLYGYIDFVARQSVPWTATGENLAAWAALVSVLSKLPAQYAATAVGANNVTGVTLPIGSVLSIGGNSYTTTGAATVDGLGNISVPFISDKPGTAYTLVLGEVLAISTPVPGINAKLTVVSVQNPGVDDEPEAELRTRMLLRYSDPPQGGAPNDYKQWALDVTGVTRAWVNPLGAGSGTVVLYTMWDDAEAASGGFPQGTDGVATAEYRAAPATGDQLVVANAIYSLRPATALLYSVAPLASPVPFTIHPAAAVPADVQAAVLAALDAAFLAYASPLAIEMEVSAFSDAISGVAGMPKFTLAAPSVPITASLGRLPVRGSVSYA